MKLRRLHREQWVPRPLERVFPFFERPENLGLITPQWLGFEILNPSPVAMGADCLIDYRIRLNGWPTRWRTRIVLYEPPLRFIDEQVTGPYAHWRHLHGFEARDGGTRLTDRVDYALPGWLPVPVEARLHERVIAPTLNRIFDYRAGVFERMFGPRRAQPETRENPT